MSPNNAVAGYNDITVTKGDAVSNRLSYNVLSGDQNQVIFHVKAETSYGENIYIVGNVPELGSWNPDKCTEALAESQLSRMVPPSECSGRNGNPVQVHQKGRERNRYVGER